MMTKQVHIQLHVKWSESTVLTETETRNRTGTWICRWLGGRIQYSLWICGYIYMCVSVNQDSGIKMAPIVQCMPGPTHKKVIKETDADLCLSTGGHHWFCSKHVALKSPWEHLYGQSSSSVSATIPALYGLLERAWFCSKHKGIQRNKVQSPDL